MLPFLWKLPLPAQITVCERVTSLTVLTLLNLFAECCKTLNSGDFRKRHFLFGVFLRKKKQWVFNGQMSSPCSLMFSGQKSFLKSQYLQSRPGHITDTQARFSAPDPREGSSNRYSFLWQESSITDSALPPCPGIQSAFHFSERALVRSWPSMCCMSRPYIVWAGGKSSRGFFAC